MWRSADTRPEAAEIRRRLTMAKSPQERAMIGFRMNAMGRAIVMQSLINRGLGGVELKIAFARRMYGRDIDSKAMNAYVDALRKRVLVLGDTS